MKVTADNEQRLIDYLLGKLDESEQEQVEAGYFAEPEQFQQLMVVEDELIDAYVRQRLSEAEKQQFENYFLRSAERRERVEFARAWLRFLEKKSQVTNRPVTAVTPATAVTAPTIEPNRAPTNSSINRYAWLATAATLIIMLLGSIWLMTERARLKDRLRDTEQTRVNLEQQKQTLQQQIGEQQTRNDQLTQEIQALRNRQQNPIRNPENGQQTTTLATIASFILKPMIVRSNGAGNKLVLPANTEWVKLQATVSEGDYTRYRAVITNIAGTEIWRQNGLKAQGKSIAKTIIVKLPIDSLTENDLILTISGIEANNEASELADFPFTIIKK